MPRKPMGPYYNQFRDIRQRIFNPRNKSYRHYKDLEFGFSSYQEFHQHVITDIGPRPSLDHQMTRRDLSLGFIPGNLCWMPKLKIARRQRTRLEIKYNRKIYCVAEFCEQFNLSYWRFLRKFKRCGDVLEAKRYATKNPSA